MAKARLIASEIFADEWFGPLSFFEQVLWTGLFARCADDQGRLIDNPILIRAAVFPYKDMPVDEISAALEKFAADRKLIRYQADGKHLIQIVNWWDHQRPQWASASTYEPPVGWQDRIRTRSGDAYIEQNWKDPAPFTWQDNLVSPPELPADDSGGTTYSKYKLQVKGEVPGRGRAPQTGNVSVVVAPEPPAESPQQPKRKPSPRRGRIADDAPVPSPSEAVKVYREIVHLWPSAAQQRAINDKVRPEQVPRWRQCVEAWELRGYNKRNVAGMLEWLDKGVPDWNGGSGGKGGRRMSNVEMSLANAREYLAEVEASGGNL